MSSEKNYGIGAVLFIAVLIAIGVSVKTTHDEEQLREQRHEAEYRASHPLPAADEHEPSGTDSTGTASPAEAQAVPPDTSDHSSTADETSPMDDLLNQIQSVSQRDISYCDDQKIFFQSDSLEKVKNVRAYESQDNISETINKINALLISHDLETDNDWSNGRTVSASFRGVGQDWHIGYSVYLSHTPDGTTQICEADTLSLL